MSGATEDVFHFVAACPALAAQRDELLETVRRRLQPLFQPVVDHIADLLRAPRHETLVLLLHPASVLAPPPRVRQASGAEHVRACATAAEPPAAAACRSAASALARSVRNYLAACWRRRAQLQNLSVPLDVGSRRFN